MVRAAAKNHGSVAVVTSPAQYADVLAALADGGFTVEQRRRLAAPRLRAHRRLRRRGVLLVRRQLRPRRGRARDRLARPHRPDVDPLRRAPLRREPAPAGRRIYQSVRTGAATRRRTPTPVSPAPRSCTARRCPTTTTSTPTPPAGPRSTSPQPCVAIIKHSNPCGIAVGPNIAAAHAKALACDPLSAYGGVVAANSAVTDAMATQITDGFAEVVIAPDFDPAAIEILTGRWKNIRLLRCAPPSWAAGGGPGKPLPFGIADFDFRAVSGGTARADLGPGRRAGRRPGELGAEDGGARPTRRRWPTWPSPGGPAARSSRTRSCWRRTARPSAWAWAR